MRVAHHTYCMNDRMVGGTGNPARVMRGVDVPTKVRVPRKTQAAVQPDDGGGTKGTQDRKERNLELLTQASALLQKVDVRAIPKYLREDVRDIRDGLPIVTQQQRDYIAGKVE